MVKCENVCEFIIKITGEIFLNTKKGGGEMKNKAITREREKTLIVRNIVFVFIVTTSLVHVSGKISRLYNFNILSLLYSTIIQ